MGLFRFIWLVWAQKGLYNHSYIGLVYIGLQRVAAKIGG